MGIVYEAWDPVLGRTVALKTIGLALAAPAADREAFEKRFLIEARIAARLSHPGIVVVHDVARDAASGLLYIALEYLVGETLAERIAGGKPMEWREALRITGRVAEALHHAHAEGVIHRDIKPANIMVLRSGDPKIMDFGIARLDTSQLTSPGELFGTPLYMAPEQALGQPVDARADLFSLGTILYTLVTGQAPFAAGSVPGILARVAHQDPGPPSDVVSGLPPDVDYITARAMAKAPADRYPDGKTLAEDAADVVLGRPARHRVEWTPPRTGERTMVSKRPAVAPPAPAADLPALEPIEEPTRATATQAPLTRTPAAAAPAASPERAAGRRRRLRADVTALLMAALLAVTAAYFHFNPGDWEFWRKTAADVGVLGPEPTPAPAAAGPAVPDLPLAPAAADDGIEPAASPSASAPAPGPESATPEGTLSPPPAAGASPPMPEAAPSPAAHPAPSPSLSPADTTSTEDDPPETEPGPAPSALPAAKAPTPDRPAPPQRRPSGPGQLVIELEHQLDGGTLEVWVDGNRVFKDKLDRHVTRRVLTYEARRGAPQGTLRLTPGTHQVRVRAQSGKTSRTARTTAAFKAGTTRRLEVKISKRVAVSLNWR
jgi:serine/threonine-protein kinase